MDHTDLLSSLDEAMYAQTEHLLEAARRLATGEDAFDPKLPEQAKGLVARAADLHNAAISYFNITQAAARRTYPDTLNVGGVELERRSYVPSSGVIGWSGPDVHGFYVTVTLFVNGKWKCKVDDHTDEGGSEAWATADTAEAAYASALLRLNLDHSNARANR